MNTLHSKSGSELAFPMLYDHMSFSTHRCWQMNIKTAYAKSLSSWEKILPNFIARIAQKGFAISSSYWVSSAQEKPWR